MKVGSPPRLTRASGGLGSTSTCGSASWHAGWGDVDPAASLGTTFDPWKVSAHYVGGPRVSLRQLKQQWKDKHHKRHGQLERHGRPGTSAACPQRPTSSLQPFGSLQGSLRSTQLGSAGSPLARGLYGRRSSSPSGRSTAGLEESLGRLTGQLHGGRRQRLPYRPGSTSHASLFVEEQQLGWHPASASNSAGSRSAAELTLAREARGQTLPQISRAAPAADAIDPWGHAKQASSTALPDLQLGGRATSAPGGGSPPLGRAGTPGGRAATPSTSALPRRHSHQSEQSSRAQTPILKGSQVQLPPLDPDVPRSVHAPPPLDDLNTSLEPTGHAADAPGPTPEEEAPTADGKSPSASRQRKGGVSPGHHLSVSFADGGSPGGRPNTGDGPSSAEGKQSAGGSGKSADVLGNENEQGEDDEEHEGGRGASLMLMGRTATSFGVMGGRSATEALKRTGQGFSQDEGFDEAELRRLRRVFNFYQLPDSADMERRHLPNLLQHLGYFADVEGVLESVAQQVSEFNTFSVEEVISVAERFAMHERDRLHKVFEAHSDKASKTLGFEKLGKVMHELGADTITTTIGEVLAKVVESKEERGMTYEDFTNFVAMFRVTEGFSNAEVLMAQDIFCAVAVPGAPTPMARRRIEMGGLLGSGSGTPTPLVSPELVSFSDVKRVREGTDEEKWLKLKGHMQAEEVPIAVHQVLGLHVRKHVLRLMDKLRLSHLAADDDSDVRSDVGSSFEADEGGPPKHHAGICFHDFLIFCRLVRSADMKDIYHLFQHRAQEDFVPTADLTAILTPLGFTLFPEAMEEFLSDAGFDADGRLSFDDVVYFIELVRSRSGFQACEIEEMSVAFKLCDTDKSEEIEGTELLDLLRFLGYSTTQKDVDHFLNKADLDCSGSIDFVEYVRVMRLFRERQILDTRAGFSSALASGSQGLGVASLPGALHSIGTPCDQVVLDLALKEAGGLESVDFLCFVKIADYCRKYAADQRRKRAGFSDKDYDGIVRLFQKHCAAGSNTLERAAFLWLLIEVGIPVQTKEEREEIFESLDQARVAARSSGVPADELGNEGDSEVTCSELVYFLRGVSRESQPKTVTREEEAIDSTGFSHAEISEFRSIFSIWLKKQAEDRARKLRLSKVVRQESRTVSRASPSRRRQTVTGEFGFGLEDLSNLSDADGNTDAGENSQAMTSMQSAIQLDALLEEPVSPTGSFGFSLQRKFSGSQKVEPKKGQGRVELTLMSEAEQAADRLEFNTLISLLASIGLILKLNENWKLNEKAEELTGRNDGSVDFTDFLLIMHWMLEINFAGIQVMTKRIASSKQDTGVVSPGSPTSDSASSGNLPSEAMRSRAARRSSV